MKIKMLSITIVGMLILIGMTSSMNADTLDGEIDVKLTQYLMGLVHPHINIESENDVSFNAEEVTEEDLTYYKINDSITISLNISDNTGKEEYIFSRALFYSAVIIRKPVINMKVGNFFKRMFPALELLRVVKVVNSTLGGNNMSTELVIPVNYTIAKETLESEEMSLYIAVMGMLPGDANGLDGIHVIDYKKIILNVDYELP
jgi:hypothetical protein